ncbi:PTS IIA-like nitrogen-regulatory protein PtsN [Betaproteobacteria bacterium]|nr:PTS IIA-like nitrogen-regulatory protein PtsN [Betaproteobacteria bacterium]GHU40902.1 PTS IIA-like nitrogen-regulatory protein PtsN [Betaproteobacteria bacterium]
MNPITHLLPENHILLGLEAGSKKKLFEEASQLLARDGGIDRALVFDNLLAREKLGSTGLGQGVAIPHGRIKGLKEAAGAFIRLAEPIDFDAPDKRPVNLVFVLLAPEQATEASLQALAALATCFANRDFREKLTAAPDAASVRELFSTLSAY